MAGVLVPACGLLLSLHSGPNPAAGEAERHRILGKAFYENPTTQAEAVAEFKRVLALSPKSNVDRLNYGLSLLRDGKIPEGIAELQAVQAADPSIPHTWFNLGIEYKRLGETAKSVEQLEKMVQLVPDEPIAHYNLGVLYKLQGKTETAVEKFHKASSLDPSFAAPHFQLFNALRADGKTDEARRELARFQELKKWREDAGLGNEDVEWSPYSEIYEVIESASSVDSTSPADYHFDSKPTSTLADAATARLITFDADGDGKPDALVVSSKGVSVLKAGVDATQQPSLTQLKDVIDAVPGDLDNDGLADLCLLTASGPKLFKNQHGVFEPLTASLPTGRFDTAAWLDFDHDFDLDLLLFGKTNVLLRNQGAAGFEAHTELFPFESGTALQAVGTRVIPDTKAHDLMVSYADRSGVLYRDRLSGLYQAQAIPELPAGARGLAVEDIDNNSTLDLAWNDGVLLNQLTRFASAPWPSKGGYVLGDWANRGMLDLLSSSGISRNLGQAKLADFIQAKGIPSGVMAWTAADFDQDGRLDALYVGPDGKVTLALNKTSTKNSWMRVHISGIKNLKLAPGSEIEIKAGSVYQKKLFDGLPVLFGLRNEKNIETVRITWANGLIQNEMNQKPGTSPDFKEAQRLSGSCPMIWTWDGKGFRFITDVLGVAPLGASSGDGTYFPVDHDEYIGIPAEALTAKDGRYEIRITEELSEVSYLDQIQLIAVDHPARTEIFSNDKWKSPPYPEFRLFGGDRRVYPSKALEDGRGNVAPAVLKRDQRYPDGFRRDLRGVASLHSLDLDFTGAAASNRAVLILHGWVDWADGSTFLSAAQESRQGLIAPKLQVKDERGNWVTVIEDMGMPAGKPKTIAVDLTSKFRGASREVRILTNMCIYWDEVFLLEDSAAPEARLTTLQARDADLHFRGFATAQIDPERRQPEQFFYGEPAATSMWNPTPGNYTRFGAVTPLVHEIDDQMVIMGSGDELTLQYGAILLPALPQGWRRDFLLKVDGWAKDRDANTAYSQTVEPLPFHGMTSYPYPAGERYPDTPALREYRKTYNTRPALRLLRPLQQLSHGSPRTAAAGGGVSQ